MFNSFFGTAKERIILLKNILQENIHVQANREKNMRNIDSNVREKS